MPTSSSHRRFDPRAFLGKVGVGVKLEKFQKNQQIYVQGEPADTVGYIQKGGLKATVTSDRGKQAIVGIFQQGHFFGEACLDRLKFRAATVLALEECLITLITREVMLSTLDSERSFSAFFMTHLLSRNIRIEEDLIDQLLNSSERRLARLLLVLSNFGREGGKPVAVTLNQEALAEMIGINRSRVSTFMNRFRQKGFISYDHGGKIEVHSGLLEEVLREKTQIRDWPADRM
jgi:CRP-like cAMP-binding protein